MWVYVGDLFSLVACILDLFGCGFTDVTVLVYDVDGVCEVYLSQVDLVEEMLLFRSGRGRIDVSEESNR